MNQKNVFFLQDNDNPHVARLSFCGFARAAKAKRWRVESLIRIDARRECTRLRDLVRHCRPDGVVAAYTEGVLGTLPPTLPVVWLDVLPSCVPETDALIAHDASGASELAAEELLRLDWPCYAAVGFHAKMAWSDRRIDAFVAAVRESRPEAEIFVWNSELPPDEKGDFRRSITPWLRSLPKPCGLFAVCDRVAENVLSAAASLGLSVPDDLAVVGVDNDEDLCLAATPPLTSVATDWERAGLLAAEALDNLMQDGHVPPARTTFGDIGIVRRASSMPSRQRVDPRIAAANGFIREHACEGISVADVVRHVGCSRSLAESLYLQAMGRTIFEEIREVRLSRALVLLSKRDVPIQVISDMCGWKSPMALRRYFKAREKMTLSAWRRRKFG